MKSGDYMIHIYVQEAHSFRLEGEKTVNPICEVQCCGETQYTESYKDIPVMSKNPVKWRQHLFFEPRQMRSEEIKNQTLSINIKNKSFLKDELIGNYNFDITKIYFSKNHTIEHQWLALSNPESNNFTDVSGVLRVSITVQAEGDEQVQLEDPIELALPADQVLLIPASIKKQYKQLKIGFVMGEHFPELDQFVGTIDAYVSLDFGGRKYRTPTVKMENLRCPFDCEFKIPLQWPLSTDRLVLKVFDEDTGKADEIVGSLIFSLRDLCQRGAMPGGLWSWFNLRGSPVNVFGSNARMMDHNPELGSTWKGRILMHITCEESKQPVFEQNKLGGELRQQAINNKMLQYPYKYQIKCEVGMGVMLDGDKPYTVHVQIGECKGLLKSNQPKEKRLSYNRWHERMEEQIFTTEYSSVEMLGDVFVYLMDGNEPVSYWTAPASEFLDPNPDYRWCVMIADRALGYLTEDSKAGMVQLKMSINDIQKNGQINFEQTQPNWKKKPPKRCGNVVQVRAYIFQCKDIPSGDSDGLSDCYISIWNQEDQKIQTQAIHDSLNPMFFESHMFTYTYSKLDECPPIILNLWDKQGMLSSDTYLGRAVIKLEEASTNELPPDGWDENLPADVVNAIPKPKWHDIRLGNDMTMPATGQVLCSFIIAPGDQVNFNPISQLQLQASIPKKDFNVDIHVFGLRELQSFGLMPIRKPYIKFHIKSLLPPEKAGAVTNVSTRPRAGSSPNINTMLSFSAMLPVETSYCPVLTCEVFDYVFLGWTQPTIGSFDIKLGDIKEQQTKDVQRKFKVLDQVIQYLKTHMSKPEQQRQLDKNLRDSQGRDQVMQDQIMKKKTMILSQLQKSELDQSSMVASSLDGGQSFGRNVKNNGYQRMGDEEDPPAAQLLQSRTTQIDSRPDEDPNTSRKKLEIKSLEQQLQEQTRKKFEEKRKKSQTLIPEDNESQQKMEAAMARSLQARYHQAKKDLDEEMKQKEKKQREIDKIAMKETNTYSNHIVILPQYSSDPASNIYKEIHAPLPSIYMQVGFNNILVVKKMIEGSDDERRRQAALPTEGQTNGSFLLQQQNDLLEDYQRQASKTKMHYRKYYKDELENCRSIFRKQVFQKIDITHGATRGVSKSLFSRKQQDAYGQNSDKKKVGVFKGLIEVWNNEERQKNRERSRQQLREIYRLVAQIYQDYHKKPCPYTEGSLVDQQERKKLVQELKDTFIDTKKLKLIFKEMDQIQMVKKQLQSKTQCTIQLYVLHCVDLASRDIGSFSDPYLRITNGETVFDDRKDYKLDNSNPRFNKLFNFKATFPGAPSIKIEVIDYDDLFGDDLIGTTWIDLDDRFFNPNWQALEQKPIEYRQLYRSSSALSQGLISLWLEIDQVPDKSSAKHKLYDKEWCVEDEPIRPYQIRVAVYDTQNIPCEDIEGTSDVYIRSYIDHRPKHNTDTHYRCMNGAASFNYRLVFDVEAPRKDCVLVLQAWDRDLLTRNDYICEWTLDLQQVLKAVQMSQVDQHINKQFYMRNKNCEANDIMQGITLEFEDENSFWLTTVKDGKDIKIRLDIRILTQAHAIACPVGTARSEPNMDPFLMPPVGRIKFTTNPCKMLDQMVSPAFKRTMIMWACAGLCCALIIFMIPMIFSDFISRFIFWMFGAGN